MQISLEEIEDLLIVGESIAIKDDKSFDVDLVLKNPDQNEPDEDEESSARTGYRLSFRPEPNEKITGVSSELLRESELEVVFRTVKKDKSINDWSMTTSVQELMEESRDFKNLIFSHIKYGGKTYTDKTKFFSTFGMDTLATVTFKIPSTVFTKFKKIANRKYGTVSERIRTLIESDLENEIKMAVRKEIFK
ncbi:MAG: hypothetical protein MUO73_09750 [Thermoplasmata archaeon]|nr:hypothetical protein [Thermoplasmata archaeon]